MAALMKPEALALTGALGSGVFTGVLLAFGAMQVPVLVTDKVTFSGQQRYWLWRRSFQTGADTVTATIFPATLLLGAATYVGSGQARTLLGSATASLLSVFLITPAVMLGANLRADILNTAKEDDHEKRLKEVVGRFQLFHSVRIALAGLATALSGYAVYISK